VHPRKLSRKNSKRLNRKSSSGSQDDTYIPTTTTATRGDGNIPTQRTDVRRAFDDDDAYDDEDEDDTVGVFVYKTK